MSKLPDISFIPVPDRVLHEMLRLAEVGKDDVIYDLGCGDGRVVIQALRAGAKRGIGVDIDPACVTEARQQAETAGVADRAEFREEDFFTTDLSGASVITLYLLDSLNVRLRPRILKQCRPGTRVVSYSFEMGDWECDAHTPMAANGVSLWIVPAHVAGRWLVAGEGDGGGPESLEIRQQYQKLAGTVQMPRGQVAAIQDGEVRGSEISGVVIHDVRLWKLHGRQEGDRMSISMKSGDAEMACEAARATTRPPAA